MIQSLLFPFAILLLASNLCNSENAAENGNSKLKSATFISPNVLLGPGAIANRNFYTIEFPTGHIALKSVNAELVDEAGNPISLHDTFVHHWLFERYFQRIGNSSNPKEDHKFAGNSGLCQENVFRHYFILGSESRQASTYVPDPFGIEIGNPAEIPPGYEERWMLNVHYIDTRGVTDPQGCTDCKCEVSNAELDVFGRPLRPNYKGGYLCCYDHLQCKLKPDFQGVRRNVYLRYTVKWVDWDSSIIPVKVYILDPSDSGKRNGPGYGPKNGCQLEYPVQPCNGSRCIDAKRTKLTMPNGGYVVYSVAHQYTGGTGATLYGQDGRVICTSVPTYGTGNQIGNEKGYIVKMTTCYPKPGSVKIANGETLLLESNYSSSAEGIAVAGIFYVLVADKLP